MTAAPPALSHSLEAVAALAEHGEGRLDSPLVERARELHQLAAERLSRSTDQVVVALAGGTGTGKSSLLNALVGSEVAAVGVRRPTTAAPLAVIVGHDQDRARPLLDWLEVQERHHRHAEQLSGAVLLDLPDIDSVEHAHWSTADRLIDRTDLLVWVVDPIKYAHALTHQRYFSRLARHAQVLLVALNQVDRLSVEQQGECVAHLRELLADAGLGGARLFATSAVTGAGLDELAEVVGDEVRSRAAPARRLQADAATLLADAAASLPRPGDLGLDVDALVGGLLQAVARARLVRSARAQYRRRALDACRSPARRLVAWLVGLVLGAVRTAGDVVGIRSTPSRPATPVSATAVQRTLLEAVAPLAGRVPDPGAHRLADLARQRADVTASALRRHVDGVPLRPSPRTWWRVVSALRGVAQLAALAGLAWLVLVSVAAWLGLPPVPQPDAVGQVPWPAALLLGGMLVSLALGGLARLLTRVGAARHAGRVEARLDEAVSAGADTALQPLHDELSTWERLVRSAYGSPPG